ncbi:hypothetical protein [Aeromonas dhakensis]
MTSNLTLQVAGSLVEYEDFTGGHIGGWKNASFDPIKRNTPEAEGNQ